MTRRIHWWWLPAVVVYEVALWRQGVVYAVLGLVLGFGLIGLGEYQKRHRT